MHAIVLAGGEGTRQMPYAPDGPKAMIGISGRPLLDVLVSQLSLNGAMHITMCVAHFGDQIPDRFGTGERYGVEGDYTEDSEPLGTAGRLRLVPRWDTPAPVVNADVLTTAGLAEPHHRHCASGAELTGAAFRHRVQVSSACRASRTGSWAQSERSRRSTSTWLRTSMLPTQWRRACSRRRPAPRCRSWSESSGHGVGRWPPSRSGALARHRRAGPLRVGAVVVPGQPVPLHAVPGGSPA